MDQHNEATPDETPEVQDVESPEGTDVEVPEEPQVYSEPQDEGVQELPQPAEGTVAPSGDTRVAAAYLDPPKSNVLQASYDDSQKRVDEIHGDLEERRQAELEAHRAAVAENAEGSESDEEEREPQTVEEVAKRALRGDYGQGQDRRRKLAEMGWDANEVQDAMLDVLARRSARRV